MSTPVKARELPTTKQQKLIRLLMENYGQDQKGKSFKDLMLTAGYSIETAKNPKTILESPTIKEGINDYVLELDKKRRMALLGITQDKIDKASARENAYISDILTKNHQLLTGGSTDNVIVVSWEK